MQVYARFKVTERKDDRRQINQNCLFGSVPDIIQDFYIERIWGIRPKKLHPGRKYFYLKWDRGSRGYFTLCVNAENVNDQELGNLSPMPFLLQQRWQDIYQCN